tara:strand:+ start:214 stop:627 length:414 start_codon:yes stop_codon:yes gene_type:complete
MTKDSDTYAIIKLVSGEELFSQVAEFYDDDIKAILLMDPCTMRQIASRRGGKSYYKIDKWVKLSEEQVYCVEMKHIMFYTRCMDTHVINTYRKWVKAINNGMEERQYTKVGVSTSMGYISSVEKTRDSLEKLFKKDS